MSYTNDFFIEEEIDGCFFRLLEEQVNDSLRQLELAVPPLEVAGREGMDAVYPDIYISECEQTEKERIIRLDTYLVTITFPVPEGEFADLYCYAYASAFEKAEPGPVVYAVLQRESAALELVVCLTAGQVRPFQRARGNREPGISWRNRLFEFFSYHHF